MITEERIKARMDQRRSLVEFDVEFGGKGIEVAGATGALDDDQPESEEQKITRAAKIISPEMRSLQDFNGSIKDLCGNVDSLIQDILKVHPELQDLDTHIVE